MSKRSGDDLTIVAVVAIVACCALPLLAIAVGGALAAAAGTAVRYWPLTTVGIALAVWAGIKIGRAVRARSRSLHEHERSDG